MENKRAKDALGYYDASTLYEGDEPPSDYEFDDMAEQCHSALTEWIEEQESNWFYCWTKNFGWRKLSGHKIFKAETGPQMLKAILPETECTYYIYKDIKIKEKDYILRIVNSHHDSPTGETYYIRLATEQEIEDNE